MTLCTFSLLFCLLAIWISSFVKILFTFFFFQFHKIVLSAYFLLICRNSLYYSCKILATHTHTHTHTHTRTRTWEQNPHIPLTPTKFFCEMNDRKTFMVLILVVYFVSTAISLRLMNILWTDSTWGHCPCHQFHSAL